jgi:hypothetical protein
MLQDTVETLKQTCFQGYPESAGCVQGSIDSRNSAIHSAYRISLRPSSLFEPRHPSLKVVMFNVAPKGTDNSRVHRGVKGLGAGQSREGARGPNPPQTSLERTQMAVSSPSATLTQRCTWIWMIRVNDPSAGSPTETLLRLLLPLSDKVH